MSSGPGRICPDLKRLIQAILDKIAQLEACRLSLEQDEERADVEASRVEKRMRRLYLAKQCDDLDLAEAIQWLHSIADGGGQFWFL